VQNAVRIVQNVREETVVHRAALSIWWALRTLPCRGPNPSVDRRVRIRWGSLASRGPYHDPLGAVALRTSVSCLPVNAALVVQAVSSRLSRRGIVGGVQTKPHSTSYRCFKAYYYYLSGQWVNNNRRNLRQVSIMKRRHQTHSHDSVISQPIFSFTDRFSSKFAAKRLSIIRV